MNVSQQDTWCERKCVGTASTYGIQTEASRSFLVALFSLVLKLGNISAFTKAVCEMGGVFCHPHIGW